MKKIFDRSERLKAERLWHTSSKPHWLRKFINRRLFFSSKRHEFAYNLIQMRLSEVLERLDIPDNGAVLISPCGEGQDVKMLRSNMLFPNMQIVGIDISDEALNLLKSRFNEVPVVCGDILTMPFGERKFDIVICNLFLHHVIDEGFNKYVQEFKRVLKPKGYLVLQEPSILYPLSWITLFIRKILYKFTGHEVIGHVHHERPFNPLLLKGVLENSFPEVMVEASSFVHNRFYLPFARLIAFIQKGFYKSRLLKYLAWCVIYVARRERGEFEASFYWKD